MSSTLTVLVAVPALPEASVEVYVSVYEPTVSVSTVPDVTTVTVPDASVAVAPASVYVLPNSTVAGLSPVTVTAGAVVSTTLTVLVAVWVFPDGSEAIYVNTYDPTAFAFTVPLVVTVIDPDKSVAEAPASVYVAPSSCVAGFVPETVITGAVVSSTITVLVVVPTLPALSVAV